MSAKALKLFFSLKQFVFQFLFRDARAVLLYQLCSSFSLEKKFIVTLFYYFVDPRRLKKFMLMPCKSLFCFTEQFWVEKAANSNSLLQTKTVFKQVHRVQIFTTRKNFYFDQQKLLLWPFIFRIGLRRFATPPNAVIIKP